MKIKFIIRGEKHSFFSIPGCLGKVLSTRRQVVSVQACYPEYYKCTLILRIKLLNLKCGEIISVFKDFYPTKLQNLSMFMGKLVKILIIGKELGKYQRSRLFIKNIALRNNFRWNLPNDTVLNGRGTLTVLRQHNQLTIECSLE